MRRDLERRVDNVSGYVSDVISELIDEIKELECQLDEQANEIETLTIKIEELENK